MKKRVTMEVRGQGRLRPVLDLELIRGLEALGQSPAEVAGDEIEIDLDQAFDDLFGG